MRTAVQPGSAGRTGLVPDSSTGRTGLVPDSSTGRTGLVPDSSALITKMGVHIELHFSHEV